MTRYIASGCSPAANKVAPPGTDSHSSSPAIAASVSRSRPRNICSAPSSATGSPRSTWVSLRSPSIHTPGPKPSTLTPFGPGRRSEGGARRRAAGAAGNDRSRRRGRGARAERLERDLARGRATAARLGVDLRRRRRERGPAARRAARRPGAARTAPEALALPWHRVLGAGGRIVFPARQPELSASSAGASRRKASTCVAAASGCRAARRPRCAAVGKRRADKIGGLAPEAHTMGRYVVFSHGKEERALGHEDRGAGRHRACRRLRGRVGRLPRHRRSARARHATARLLPRLPGSPRAGRARAWVATYRPPARGCCGPRACS